MSLGLTQSLSRRDTQNAGGTLTTNLAFEIAGGPDVSIAIEHAVIAGWTARDRAAVDHHIAELEAIGVAPPSSVPLFYRVSAALLTTAPEIDVVDGSTSGEVEPVLIDDGTTLFLGLGSDHTDRRLEAHSVALSKQVCAKPVARTLWRFEDVAAHLDRIEMRSFVRDVPEGDWVPYQDGTLASIRPLTELMEKSPFAAGPARLRAGTAMMCGTFGVLSGGVRPSRYFRMEMRDPVRGRILEHTYESRVLPAVK